MTHVVVVGGGITGLACAHRLLESARAHQHELAVTIVESQAKVGGVIRTSPFAELPHLDEGADAFLLRVPAGLALARSVGLDTKLTSPAVSHASVWRNGMHKLPDGLLLGVPTNMKALAKSRLISWRGKARAALDVALPRTTTEPDSLGRFMRTRLGNEVHEMFIDPLVGSIYAADTDHFSLEAMAQLRELAESGRSMLLSARSRPKPKPISPDNPIFAAPVEGMGALVDATYARVQHLGGVVQTSTEVQSIERVSTGRYVVHTSSPEGSHTLNASHVVICTPAKHSAKFFAESDPIVSSLLASSEHASVVMVSLAIPKTSFPAQYRGSGYLVPKPEQRFITAVSFASQKWKHLDSSSSAILRVSLGRDGAPLHEHDDDELLSFVLADLKVHLGTDVQPSHTRITRWKESFPQYRPHHFQHVAHVEKHLAAELPNVFVAGASWRGIGVPSCIEQGVKTADEIVATLSV